MGLSSGSNPGLKGLSVRVGLNVQVESCPRASAGTLVAQVFPNVIGKGVVDGSKEPYSLYHVEALG